MMAATTATALTTASGDDRLGAPPVCLESSMPSSLPRAGFWRRIGALVYDWLLVASVLIIAQALYFFVVALLVWSNLIVLASGQDVASYIITLHGTTPAVPKQPEGTIWKESDSTAVASN